MRGYLNFYHIGKISLPGLLFVCLYYSCLLIILKMTRDIVSIQKGIGLTCDLLKTLGTSFIKTITNIVNKDGKLNTVYRSDL